MGLSRASKIGVVVKGGGALERLAAGRVLLFDKTGTLTQGKPVLVAVIAPAAVGSDELLALPPPSIRCLLTSWLPRS